MIKEEKIYLVGEGVEWTQYSIWWDAKCAEDDFQMDKMTKTFRKYILPSDDKEQCTDCGNKEHSLRRIFDGYRCDSCCDKITEFFNEVLDFCKDNSDIEDEYNIGQGMLSFMGVVSYFIDPRSLDDNNESHRKRLLSIIQFYDNHKGNKDVER